MQLACECAEDTRAIRGMFKPLDLKSGLNNPE